MLEQDAKGHSRMVPVTILYQNHWYDAAQYQSNPVPMALEPGNVYDVLQSNLPIALFTTDQPGQAHGIWFSMGKWRDKSKEPEPNAKTEVTLADNSGGPVLKRHKGADSSGGSDTKGSGSGSSPGSTSKTADDNDPDRPTLKRPESAKDSGGSSPAPDNTSTPTIAKRSAQPVDQDLTRDTNESDPDRPVLRKTQAGTNPTNVNVTMTAPVGTGKASAPVKVAPEPGTEQLKQYVAISDAEKTEYRPFAYELKAEEKATLVQKLQKIAAPELQKWALAHGGVKLPAAVMFNDFDMRAFDVDYSNNPELVFTASYTPPTGKTKLPIYYLTLVAREDSNQDLNPLFSQISDSTRLDAYSRLELIDAVDADGYGRGSLLFREYTDSGKAFIVYRVDAYNLTKQFEGASGE